MYLGGREERNGKGEDGEEEGERGGSRTMPCLCEANIMLFADNRLDFLSWDSSGGADKTMPHAAAARRVALVVEELGIRQRRAQCVD